jgi:hypothetical protein
VLSSQKATVTTTFWCTMVFWAYILMDFRRKHFRPNNPDTRATLKVTTEQNQLNEFSIDHGLVTL